MIDELERRQRRYREAILIYLGWEALETLQEPAEHPFSILLGEQEVNFTLERISVDGEGTCSHHYSNGIILTGPIDYRPTREDVAGCYLAFTLAGNHVTTLS